MADPLTDEQLGALSNQELVDYLCTAVEELDILYVEIWLRRLTSRGLKDAAVKAHSTKPFCALTIVGGSRQAPLAELILHALLFRLPHTAAGRPTGVRFDEMWLRPWAENIVIVHHTEGSRRASYCKARQLCACRTDAEVAALLDRWYEAKKLPTLHASAVLTGSKPLPRLSTPSSPIATSFAPLIPSSPSVPVHTTLEHAHPVPSTSTALFSRIRISPVPPNATVELITGRLPELDGLRGVELAELGAAELIFADGEAAKRAREEILEAYCGRKPLTVTFLPSPPTSKFLSCRRSRRDAESGKGEPRRSDTQDYGAAPAPTQLPSPTPSGELTPPPPPPPPFRPPVRHFSPPVQNYDPTLFPPQQTTPAPTPATPPPVSVVTNPFAGVFSSVSKQTRPPRTSYTAATRPSPSCTSSASNGPKLVSLKRTLQPALVRSTPEKRKQRRKVSFAD